MKLLGKDQFDVPDPFMVNVVVAPEPMTMVVEPDPKLIYVPVKLDIVFT